jgi:transposase
MKGRKTTLEERVEVVKYLIETEIDYHKTSIKFKVSYQQVYQWYQKYLLKGVEGLIDRRGIKKQKHELEENEILRRENERLRRALELSQAEIEVLKKNEELEEKAHLAELDIKNSMKP